jgi:hypothetical protein
MPKKIFAYDEDSFQEGIDFMLDALRSHMDSLDYSSDQIEEVVELFDDKLHDIIKDVIEELPDPTGDENDEVDD